MRQKSRMRAREWERRCRRRRNGNAFTKGSREYDGAEEEEEGEETRNARLNLFLWIIIIKFEIKEKRWARTTETNRRQKGLVCSNVHSPTQFVPVLLLVAIYGLSAFSYFLIIYIYFYYVKQMTHRVVVCCRIVAEKSHSDIHRGCITSQMCLFALPQSFQFYWF